MKNASRTPGSLFRHKFCPVPEGGGFRYRISPPYQESLFFTPNASENASRTVGACFLHGAHIPYRRRGFPVPNANQQPPPKTQKPTTAVNPQHPQPPRPTQNTPSIHNHPATTALQNSTPKTKEVPTECYFNRDFRKAAAAYSPTWWGSTIGASELNFSVRYGKRWVLTAITAAVFYLREISWSEALAYSKDLGLLVQVD